MLINCRIVSISTLCSKELFFPTIVLFLVSTRFNKSKTTTSLFQDEYRGMVASRGCFQDVFPEFSNQILSTKLPHIMEGHIKQRIFLSFHHPSLIEQHFFKLLVTFSYVQNKFSDGTPEVTLEIVFWKYLLFLCFRIFIKLKELLQIKEL